MIIRDERLVAAPPELCFRIAADVERWPDILPHYRYVRARERASPTNAIVEMAAWRGFVGPIRYPTWWVSEMRVDEAEPAVHYRHIDGITKGMIVKWWFEERDGGTWIRITHAWDGPRWPLIGGLAWRLVIAPFFVHVIASRTLAGVRAEAERQARHAARS
jgi:ribosome-associated toxin RatA of RatAB toxin-antitoxin module